MTQRRQIAVGSILLCGILSLAGGCEDAAKKSVVRAPVPGSTITVVKPGSAPAPKRASAQAPMELPPLPVAPKRRTLVMFTPAVRGTKEDLIARVEQKFA